MKFIKNILADFYRWFSGPDLDLKRFEELESKKTRGKEWL